MAAYRGIGIESPTRISIYCLTLQQWFWPKISEFHKYPNYPSASESEDSSLGIGVFL